MLAVDIKYVLKYFNTHIVPSTPTYPNGTCVWFSRGFDFWFIKGEWSANGTTFTNLLEGIKMEFKCRCWYTF